MIVGVLVLAGVAVQISKHALSFPGHEKLFGAVRLFDLDGESTLPSWYSSLALLWCASLLWLMARAARALGLPHARHWFALSMIFGFVAVDEAARIHETAINPLRRAFNPTGVFYYAWIIPASAAVLIVVLVYLGVVIRLPGPIRRLFFVSFIIFMVGAVGLEMVEGIFQTRYVDPHSRLDFNLIIAAEECLEMVAVVLFSHALMWHLGSTLEEVQLTIAEVDPQPVEHRPDVSLGADT